MEIENISRGGAESRRREGIAGARSAPEGKSGMDFASASPRLRVKPSADAERAVATARTWIGTPYVHQASVKGVGCDCLGLLRGVWRELFGAEPEAMPPYSPDWAEATGAETLYMALARHLRPVALQDIAPGDVALFRMHPRGPAKHCGIVAEKITSPLWGGRSRSERGTAQIPSPDDARGRSHHRPPHQGEVNSNRTLIHARQNKRVNEEQFSPLWQKKLAYLFTLAPAGGEGRVRGS
jgi:NlpC/P60 family putative phage cell wall peptidase